ncbi:GroES-like protein [Hypomontagnella submonticulosa]|nr:GroES-like protein [Hypomontagnella submonticulosa]
MAIDALPPSTPAHMKALQVTAFNQGYKLVTVPVPTVGPFDLLVKVAVASYCHTDKYVVAGIFGTKLPVTASHEGSGTVAAVGNQVTGFRLGDRVMCGIPIHPCGKCADCLGPDEFRHYCLHAEGHVGLHVDGCFAEYVLVDARFSTKLPDLVGLTAAAPLACAGRTIWRGVKMAALEPGQWLLIVGSGGGLGHIGVQFAKAMGYNVIGVDARDEGLEMTRRVGADLVLDARDGQDAVVAAVQKATAGEGARATIMLSDAPGAVALGATATRTHGTLIQIAAPDGVVPFKEMGFRDIRVRSSLQCSPKEARDMVRFMAELERRGANPVRVETTAFAGLESIEKLMALVTRGTLMGKAVIVVDQAQIDEEKRKLNVKI